MDRAEELFERLMNGGEAEVTSFINTPVTEELFLDYKRSADNGAGTSLHNTDRMNLAKAISGFGNSEGGVVVWGVDCRAGPDNSDVPTEPVYVSNPVRFKTWLEQITGSLTIPIHHGVRHHAIETASGGQGFVVTLVNSGMHAPYQTVKDLSYYIRVGSSFSKAPHAVLAGMFGKRPYAKVQHSYLIGNPGRLAGDVVRTELGIILKNYGRGIAKNFFINLDVMGHPGPNCTISFQPSNESDVWWGRFAFDAAVSLIAKDGYYLPPEAYIIPVSFDIKLKPPFEGPFVIEGVCGSADSELHKFEKRIEAAEIQRAYEEYMEQGDTDTSRKTFNKTLYRGDMSN